VLRNARRVEGQGQGAEDAGTIPPTRPNRYMKLGPYRGIRNRSEGRRGGRQAAANEIGHAHIMAVAWPRTCVGHDFLERSGARGRVSCRKTWKTPSRLTTIRPGAGLRLSIARVERHMPRLLFCRSDCVVSCASCERVRLKSPAVEVEIGPRDQGHSREVAPAIAMLTAAVAQ